MAYDIFLLLVCTRLYVFYELGGIIAFGFINNNEKKKFALLIKKNFVFTCFR